MRALLHLGFLVAVTAACAGCAIPGLIAANVLPPEKMKAKYQPQDVKSIVVIDDPGRRLPSIQLMGTVSARVEKNLKDNDTIAEFTDARKLNDLRAAHQEFESWPIDRIVRAVGADQAIYVHVDRFELADSPGIYRPTASARVKIVAADGTRLFPAINPDGFPVFKQMIYRHDHGLSRGDRALMNRKLADYLGKEIAQLFYDHLLPQPGTGEKFVD